MQKKSLVVGVIIIIIGIVLGYGLGQVIQLSPREETNGRFNVLQELLESKVVDSINVSVFGTIVEISGKNLTIEKEGKNFVLVAGEETTVFKVPVVSAEPGENQNPVPEKIGFDKLKVNDVVSAALLVSPEGKLETISIFVVPEASPSPQE